jgi:hypothetical protein
LTRLAIDHLLAAISLLIVVAARFVWASDTAAGRLASDLTAAC